MTTTKTKHNFPVFWDPRDAETCWMYDAEHMPNAVPPLALSMSHNPRGC